MNSKKQSKNKIEKKHKMLNLKEGEELVRLARFTIKTVLEGKSLDELKDKAKKFRQKNGLFVTLHTFPSGELRGCIGFPWPVQLGSAIIESAQAAAFEDPRFLPLQKKELNKIIIEISILTEPKLIECSNEDIPDNVEIGEDGLICRLGDYSGLLLPQVAVEQKWNSKQFVENACIKAGLAANRWLHPDCKFWKFRAQIFSEEKPEGKIILGS